MFADCFVFDQATVFNMCNAVSCATIVLLIMIFEEYSTELTSVDYSSYHIPYSEYSSVAFPAPVGSTGDTKYNITTWNTTGLTAQTPWNTTGHVEHMELNQTCMRATDFTHYMWGPSGKLIVDNNYTNLDSNNLLCSTFGQNYSSASWQMYNPPNYSTVSSSVIQFATQYKCSLRCANAACPNTNGANNPGQDKHIRSAFVTTYRSSVVNSTYKGVNSTTTHSLGKETDTSGVRNFIGERLFFKWQARGIDSYSALVYLYDQVSLSL